MEVLERRELLAADLANVTVERSQLQSLVDGIEAFAELGTAVGEVGEMNAPLGLVVHADGSPVDLADVTDVGDVLQRNFIQPFDNFVSGLVGNADTDSVVAFLDSLANVDMDCGGLTAGELNFVVNVNGETTLDSLSVDLGEEAEELKLEIDGDINASMTGKATLAFTFGLLLDPELGSEQSFFVRDTNLDVSASLDTTANTALRFGALEADADVTLDVVAFATIELNDIEADAESNVTLSEINGYPVTDIATITPGSNASGTNNAVAVIDVDASLGTWASGNLQLTISGDAIDGELSVDTDGDMELMEFTRVTADDLVSGFELATLFIDGFGASSPLDVSVPFTNSTLGEHLIRLSNFFQSPTDFRDETGVNLFDSIQDFAELVGADLDYDPATNQIVIDLSLALEGQNESSIDIDNVDALSNVDTRASILVEAEGTADFDLVIDLDLNPELEDTERFSLTDVEIAGTLTMRADTAPGSADFGIVGIDYGSVNVVGSATIAATLTDPNPSTSNATFAELFDALLTPDDLLAEPIDNSGSASLALAGVSVQPDLFEVPNGRSIIALQMPEITNPTNIDLNTRNVGILGNLGHLTTDDLIDSFSAGIADALGLSSEVVPAIGIFGANLDEITSIGLGDAFGDITATITNSFDNFESAIGYEPKLQHLVDVLGTHLSELLGVDVEVTVDSENDNSFAVEVAIDFINAEGEFEFEFDLSLLELADLPGGETSVFAGFGEFGLGVDSTPIMASAGVGLELNFEFDVEEPLSPHAFLRSDSGLKTELLIDHQQDLQANVTLGVAGLDLVNGTLVVADDSSNPKSGATIFVGPISKNQLIPLGELGTVPLDVGMTGEMLLDFHLDGVSDLKSDQLHVEIDLDPLDATVMEAPDFFALSEATNIEFDLSALPTGLLNLFEAIESALNIEVFGGNYPVVGASLADIIDFMTKLIDSVREVGNLKDFTAETIEVAFIDFFKTLPSDVSFDISLKETSPEEVRFRLELTDSIKLDKAEVNTNLGVPLINADLAASLDAIGSYTVGLTFGINKDDGVFIQTTDEDLSVDLDVDFDGEMAGRLGFFQVTADADTPEDSDRACKNADGTGVTAFHAEFAIGLISDDGRLALSDIGDGNFIDTDGTGLTGCAAMDIVVGSALTKNEFGQTVPIPWMPSFDTTVGIDWDFSSSDLKGSVPEVTYENPSLNLGNFLSGSVGPWLQGIDGLLDDIHPIIEVLAGPLPAIGEHLPPETDSLLDIAATVYPSLRAVAELGDVALHITSLADSIDVTALDDTGKSKIVFGDLSFISPNCGNNCPDPRDPDAEIDVEALVSELSSHDFETLLSSTDGLPLKSKFDTTTTSMDLDFPILTNPLSLFEAVLGLGEADLVTLDLPSFDIGIPLDLTYDILLPIFEVGIFGTIETGFDLSFGYDTAGLRAFQDSGELDDLLQGFYVSDTASPDGSGEDIDQLYVTGAAVAGLGVGFDGLLEGYAGGGIEATVGVDVLDHDGDGKVRGHEFISSEGCLELSGELNGVFEAGVTYLAARYRHPLAQTTLDDFNTILRCTLPSSPKVERETATLAELKNGELHLLMGDRAHERSVAVEIEDEWFDVTIDSNDTVLVSAYGKYQSFAADDVESIHAAGGTGNDRIRIHETVSIPATLAGGVGDDLLVGGSGKDTLEGGPGNDTLKGRGEVDDLSGGLGNDLLYGFGFHPFVVLGAEIDPKEVAEIDLSEGDVANETEENTIDGGDGDDEIHGANGIDNITTGNGLNVVFGYAGADEITGGDDRDVIYGGNDKDNIKTFGGDDFINGGDGGGTFDGGNGADEIYGGNGEDRIIGGAGNDELFGFGGSDTINGDDGEDYIDGGDGNDFLYGGDQPDTIDGGEGNDEIDGDEDNDLLLGGVGNDEIFGSDGDDIINGRRIDFDPNNHEEPLPPLVDGQTDSDTIDGGNGNDVIYGNEHKDRIYGGLGDDLLFGHDGNDEIYGNDGASDPLDADKTDADTIYGGADGDQIYGDAGRDLLYGEDGDDTIHGNLGNDLIEGAEGDDTLHGDEGIDEIYGHVGDDTIEGGDGSDFIRGAEGNDTIYGDVEGNSSPNPGADTIFGDGGDDVIEGGGHDDLIEAGSGDDYVSGQDGNDTIYGDSGDDRLEGDDGIDKMYGNSGHDLMYGDNGSDEMFGGPDNDTMRGGDGDDKMHGGDGNDLMLGHLGGDTINGDADDDVLYGFAGNDTIDGGPGNDRVMGEAGNDKLIGGLGMDVLIGGLDNDVLDGGDGEDRLLGDEGVDVLDGGNHNDLLIAGDGIGNQLLGGNGDDQIVGSDAGSDDVDFTDDKLFGDHIEGGPGADTIAGLGGGDYIDGGEGNDTIYGGHHKDEFVAEPAGSVFNDVIELDGNPNADAKVSTGAPQLGHFVELSGSVSDNGVSSVGGFEQSTFSTEEGVYVTWVGWHNGNSEVYLAYHAFDETGSRWIETKGSASGGGISNDTEQSRRPTVTLIESSDPNFPDELIVAWTKIDDTGNASIEVARFDYRNDEWIKDSAAVDHADFSGGADHAQLVRFGGESVLLGWLQTDSSTGLEQVNVLQYIYEPRCYVGFFGGAANMTSDAANVSIDDYDLTTTKFRAGVAASHGEDGDHNIDVFVSAGHTNLTEAVLCNTVPNVDVEVLGLGGPAVQVGSFTDGDLVEPTLAMHTLAERYNDEVDFEEREYQIVADIYVGWHRIESREDQVDAYVIRQGFEGPALLGDAAKALIPVYIDNVDGFGGPSISDTFGYAAKPEFAISDEQLFYSWIDDGVGKLGDTENSIYIMSGASGSDRILREVVHHDASGSGINPKGRVVDTLSLSVAPEGDHNDEATVAFTYISQLGQQVYLRHDRQGADGINLAPTISVPTNLTTSEDTPVLISGLRIDDSDAGIDPLQLTLSADRGTVRVRTNVQGGITSVDITGNQTNEVVITAPLATINRTLSQNGIGFLPTQGFHGLATIHVDVNDQGNSGDGGPQSATESIEVTVVEVTTGQPGDLNDDDKVDASDIDTFFASLAAGDPPRRLDLNGDGVSNRTDADHLIQRILLTRRGDTNLDGHVNFADFLQLSANFGQSAVG